LAQLVERLLNQPRSEEGSGKQGFDFRITATAHHPFEGRDCLVGAVLRHEGSTENRRRDSVTPVSLQDSCGEPLGLVRPLHL
jgi:hypothetical protein